MSLLRGAFNRLLLGANTLLAFALMAPPALLKLLVPADGVRTGRDRVLNRLAGGWVAVNNAWIAGACPVPWQIRGIEGLNPRGWYLVSSNHQSWVDILVLQRSFHGRIPFLKFFLKRELIWVRVPTAVINFVEGTRFTAAKHAAQSSSYRHLLEPRSGGLGVALATMGEQFEAMLDVTIVYPEGTPSFWTLLCGRMGAVTVDVRQRAIPPHLLGGDPSGDKARRQHIRKWIEAQWKDKDRLIRGLLAAHRGARR
ncbi:1-acyl-sn-glycerol-3-phosphate acyltransferase [Variovorax sp. V15]|uniref:1-acyl-sn-glycerol-3-phosphate acyltransferase n=1 Tax=Variovorax sp. V15 TaxID=3065952 RepID=UPI0034E8F90F